FAMQDRLTDSVAAALKLPRGTSRTPTPSGLDTASEQERYLQAIGLLQRYDKPASVDAAIGLLQGLAAEAPSSPLVQAALGRTYLFKFNDTRESRWVELAESSCSRAQQLNPEFPEVDVTLGELRIRTGKAAEAILSFQRAIAAQPNNFDALLGLARAQDASAKAGEAEATYRRAIQLQPSYFAGYSKLAGFYYAHGQYGKAAEMFRRVTELTPDNARSFANLGATYYLMGSFDSALAAFKKSLELEPNDVAYTNIGTAQFFLGHYKESSESFEKAVRLTPHHFHLWANLADAYRWTKGLETKAPEAYDRAIALSREELRVNPRNGQAHSYLAICLAKTGHAREAEDQAREALSLEPSDPERLYYAAVVSTLGGRSTEALERLRRAIAAGFPRVIALRDPELAGLKNKKAFQEIVRVGT
ncbi:MAG: tetratricopeptide repeat protein, partial [Thermoanaerobaculia bacterium]